MVGRIKAPKDVHIPITGTFEYVTLYGKRGFAGVIKFRLWVWDYPKYPSVPQI
jgi:hypothetical protein